jgi:hypothetical protein
MSEGDKKCNILCQVTVYTMQLISERKVNFPLIFGLFVVSLVWFLFNSFNFLKGGFNIYKFTFWIAFTDTAGMFGLGFRTMAALIAVITVSFFLVKRELSKSELLMSLRWIILGETVYLLSLFPVLLWFIALDTGASSFGLGSIIETLLPVTVQSIIIPVVLIKLFLAMSPNKPEKGIIRWGLIATTFYTLMFWLNNTGNWTAALMKKGAEYVVSYPDHILSFGLTTIGLLSLTLYTAYFTKKSMSIESFKEIELRKIGVIITALGLYFFVIYVMWLFVGTEAKWSSWYAWFLGHNMDLWVISLPLIGIPLLFHKKN